MIQKQKTAATIVRVRRKSLSAELIRRCWVGRLCFRLEMCRCPASLSTVPEHSAFQVYECGEHTVPSSRTYDPIQFKVHLKYTFSTQGPFTEVLLEPGICSRTATERALWGELLFLRSKKRTLRLIWQRFYDICSCEEGKRKEKWLSPLLTALTSTWCH